MNGFHDLKGERKYQILITTDKRGSITGKATRDKCHKGTGIPHLAFIAFVFDKDNRLLLTKRSDKKSLWSGFWDAGTISHVLPGETVEEAAKRRGREELGIEVDFRDLGAFYYHARHGDSSENEYCHVLTGKTFKKPDPNPVEIGEIKTITWENLTFELKTHPDQFAPWFNLAIERFGKEINKYSLL